MLIDRSTAGKRRGREPVERLAWVMQEAGKRMEQLPGDAATVARMEAAGRNPGPDLQQASRITLRSIRATDDSGAADV